MRAEAGLWDTRSLAGRVYPNMCWWSDMQTVDSTNITGASAVSLTNYAATAAAAAAAAAAGTAAAAAARDVT